MFLIIHSVGDLVNEIRFDILAFVTSSLKSELLNLAMAPTRIPIHYILAAVQKNLTKFTVGEANHVRSKVISIIENHRSPKLTLSLEEAKALKELCTDQK